MKISKMAKLEDGRLVRPKKTAVINGCLVHNVNEQQARELGFKEFFDLRLISCEDGFYADFLKYVEDENGISALYEIKPVPVSDEQYEIPET